MKNTVGDFSALLSPLESDVMHVLWPDRRMKVKQIYERLTGKRKVALSSVAVILDRLHERGIVGREMEPARGGVRYTYYPTGDRGMFEQSVVKDAVDKLIARYGKTAVAYFHERFNSKGRR